ncbi:MAG: hypothetical protein RR982_07265, partial [Kiritimatiellia bacterium]
SISKGRGRRHFSPLHIVSAACPFSTSPADRQRYRLSAVRHRFDSPMKAAQMAALCTGKLK